MNKEDLEVIIEQLEDIEKCFDDLDDCVYEIRKVLQKQLDSLHKNSEEGK